MTQRFATLEELRRAAYLWSGWTPPEVVAEMDQSDDDLESQRKPEGKESIEGQ